MAVTIKDIAKEAGCGLATVSSYLNGGNVRPDNREKIEAAITSLNYVVNETARQLKTNRTRMVGAIIPELNSTFASSVLSRIEDILRKKGYAMLVCDCRTDSEREKEAVDFMLNRRVDGLFVMPVDPTGENLTEFVESGKPLITIDRKIAGLKCDSVSIDNREAIREAVELLVQNGHKKIGFVVGPTEINAAHQRLRGFEMACMDNHIECGENLVFHADGSIESGSLGIKTLREKNPDMTAVIVSSFNMTMGAMIEINETGIKVPEELSIIGFDNPQFARAVHPKLTIINQTVDEIGEKAAELMLMRLEGTNAEAFSDVGGNDLGAKQEIWLRSKILEGKSVRKINH